MVRRSITGPFVIEPVEEGDLLAVMRLAWRTTNHLYPAPFLAAVARQPRTHFRVVRDASTHEVLAFLVAGKQPGLQTNFMLLAADPRYVGRGLRRALLADVQAALRAEGLRDLVVELPTSEADLITFYRSQGFDLVGMEPAAFRNDSDHVLLAKPLV